MLLTLLPMSFARNQFFIDFGKGKGLQHPFLLPKPLLQPAAVPVAPSSRPAAAATHRPAAVSSPLELTARYNTFPWTFTTDRIYIMFMVPPAAAPAPTAAYAGMPQLQGYIPTRSYLALITYSGELAVPVMLSASAVA